MSETERTELQASFQKLAESHPVVPAFKPTMAFLHNGSATLSQIDVAGMKLCAELASAKAESAEGCADATAAVAKAEEKMCPKTAASLAAVHSRMKQSVALTAKANELMLAAYKSAHGGECAEKSQCTKSEKTAALASAEGKATKSDGCCSGAKATAALASVDNKSGAEKEAGGCCSGAKATAALASADNKSGAEKKAGGCCSGAKTTAALASADDKAAGEKKEGGCCAAKAATAAMASAEGKPCVKTLVNRSQEIVTQSGQLLAQWQDAGIRLASMEGTERESVEKMASTVAASCPIGSRMPDTLETVAGLLRDAATLNAQAIAECRNPNVAKMIPAGGKELAEARMQVIAAMLNVLEKCNSSMKPARQVASAQ
jgi:hypothetical protein